LSTPTDHAPIRPTFEAITVGDIVGPVRLDVDAHFARRYAFTVDDYDPLWFRADEDPAAKLTPMALVPDLLRLFFEIYDPEEDFGIHQKEEVWLHGLVPIGETVELTGKFVDKYVKRDKGYYVVEAEARSARSGELYVAHRIVEIAELDPGSELATGSAPPSGQRWVKGDWPADREPLRSVKDASVGDPVLGPSKRIRQDQMSVFSNIEAFWRSIHTDAETAQRAGHRAPLAQGMMGACYVSEMAAAVFGPGWHESGHLDVSFVAPMYAGDEVQARGVVVDIAEGDSGTADRAELEVWLQTQDGVKVCVGWIDSEVR
jgi:acyl dehydratase